jgi:hypothetical protein
MVVDSHRALAYVSIFIGILREEWLALDAL